MKDEIIEKIKELFGDTSQPASQTKEQLEEIRDEAAMLIEAINEDY